MGAEIFTTRDRSCCEHYWPGFLRSVARKQNSFEIYVTLKYKARLQRFSLSVYFQSYCNQTFNNKDKAASLFTYHQLTMTSTMLILAECRTPVTCELEITLLSMSSRSSVDRAPARCSGGHGFDSSGGFRIFFVSRSCHVNKTVKAASLPRFFQGP